MRRAAMPLLLIVAATSQGRADVGFNRQIRAILSENCYQCHGPDTNQRQANLRLDTSEGATTDLGGHRAIVPGKPGESELFRRISSEDPDERMPPSDFGKQLSADQIELLRQWIAEGGKYERHWAFVTPSRPAVPEAHEEWVAHNAIDHFVLARLAREGVAPADAADRYTLLRRVSLDLTGLPPSPDDVRAFLADESPGAFEAVVDRLLASDRYGEHLARYWLDAARYADTNGYQYDLEREQWAWRDWVIHAFNTNKSFDQFTIEQLAGDLLPNATDQQRLATAFHRNHPITIEGGVIDEEYRTEYVVDRVVTTATTWLGMTFVCARCHDHKYDPVSQREFYEFFAFFNQVPERGNNGFDPKLKVASPLQQGRLQVIEAELATAEQHFQKLSKESGVSIESLEADLAKRHASAWSIVAPEAMTSSGGAELTLLDDQSVLAGGKNPATDTYELTIQADAVDIRAIRLEALTHESLSFQSPSRGTNGNFVLSEFELAIAPAGKPDAFQSAKFSSAEADYSQNNFEIAKAIDGTINTSGWAVDGNRYRVNRTAVFTLAEPGGIEGGSVLRIRMHHKYGLSHQIGRFRIALATGPHPPLPLSVASILTIPRKDRTAAQQQQLQEHVLAQVGSPGLRAAAKRLNEVRQRREDALKTTPATMVMRELDKPRATHVLFRGQYDQKRDEVSAGTPDVFPPLADEAPRNRLGLARWLVSADNPLTARVTVNRLWERFFGIGLVKTTEDFGSQGDMPSHPELLDWLSVEFVDSGWDLKHLQKLIVMSATYRQSSRVAAELLSRDPENRLLARGPRFRLDAEVIRDSAVWASGKLHRGIGGPSVFPYHPAGLWQEINNRPNYSRVYKQDSGDKLYRRSLYTFWKRTVPPPSMSAFDAPEREYCVVRRSRTNTPLQAFVLLHDPQFVEAARNMAERVMREGGETPDERLHFAFIVALCRPPSPEELRLVRGLYDERRKQYAADETAARQLLAVGDGARDETLNIAEHAAHTAVARLLLNTSEFVTKD